jgi:hypothetical protein
MSRVREKEFLIEMFQIYGVKGLEKIRMNKNGNESAFQFNQNVICSFKKSSGSAMAWSET